VCAVACFIFGNTTNPIIGGSARFLMGMGSACGLIGTIKLGTLWLESKHIAKVTSLAILMGTAGASLGGVPLEILLNKLGFENTMDFLGLIGLVVCIIIYFFVSNHPPIDHNEELPDIFANNSPFADIWYLIKTPQAWVLAVYGMFMYLPITVIGVVWGVSFIKATTEASDIIAASVVSTMFLGAAIGGPAFAYFSDFIKNRRLPMLCGSVVSTFVWFVVIAFEVPFYLLYVLFFLGGFAYTAKCLSFASICETMPLKMSGISIAFVNAVVMSTGTIFLPIIGALISYHNNASLLKNIPPYSGEDYRFALIIVPIFLLLSFIIIFFIKETHPDHKVPKEYEPFINTGIL
ncbi:MAG: MFS transporter, partial [Rickettsiaceae bacterium]|nr:MFS transporter [Rickettsiaceae bacterium]